MKQVLVETSARHIHLSREAVDVLFGEGYALTKKKDLSQPGQFACEEKLEVVGPKGKIKASILGPTRPDTQVELSLTDARSIGVSAPIRESGSIAGTPGCKLVNPENGAEYEIATGVIAAKRHIHLTPADAKEFGVEDKQIVKVKLDTERPLIFDGVVVRVNENFAAAMHIDTDESNAACAFGTVYGEIIL
jgi:putative phosphotransacetylase